MDSHILPVFAEPHNRPRGARCLRPQFVTTSQFMISVMGYGVQGPGHSMVVAGRWVTRFLVFHHERGIPSAARSRACFLTVSGSFAAFFQAWRMNTHSSRAKPLPSAASTAIRLFLGATASVGKVGGCLTTSRDRPCSQRGMLSTSVR